MAETSLAVFLSPHFDDVPLSCGGMAARLSRMGVRCISVVVCAAPAPAGRPLSEFAQRLHADWEASLGIGVASLNEVRRNEEKQALKLLGLEHVFLDFPDAPYRAPESGRHYYTSNETLFGAVDPEERLMLAPRIAQQIERVVRETRVKGRVRVFAPLGVGFHVDHQLVFMASRRLGPRLGVLYYEDFPYVAREGALEARLRAIGMPLKPRAASTADLLGVKIAAIARYKSQLDVLFGSSERMPGVVRAYAQSASGGAEAEYAERFWQAPPSYVLGL